MTSPNGTDRRRLLVGSAGAIAALGMPASRAAGQAAAPARAAAGAVFKDPLFQFQFEIALGRCAYGAGDPGKILWVAGQIPDGDYETAYQVYTAAGDEALRTAQSVAGRAASLTAYLWAANFYDSAMYFCDGSKDPSRLLPTWRAMRACWDKAAALLDPPAERVEIPYEGTSLHGYFLRADASKQKRPLLILNNGSDGSPLAIWCMGGAAGTARGYNCLIFDGPGQGYALFEQKLYFRPDWEKVITPVVDWALARADVQRPVTLLGISQGGYWVPRAAAFEKRIDFAVADPGVVDVSTSWVEHLPPPLVQLLQGGNKAEFDKFMSQGTPAQQATLRFRMRPFGFASPFDTFKAVLAYNLTDVASRIQCPIAITSPEGEQFWPGQSQRLFDIVGSPAKRIVPFTAEEGAASHCEPLAPLLRDMRIFETLNALQRASG